MFALDKPIILRESPEPKRMTPHASPPQSMSTRPSAPAAGPRPVT
jgi:hypothetical protein